MFCDTEAETPPIELSIVIPCHNESANLTPLFERLETVLHANVGENYEIICVDDGSRDDTLTQLCQHTEHNPHLRVLELSRNFGKEAALSAGLDASRGQAVIPMDGDCQHPPELIPEMLTHWRNGSDMVLARRRSRLTDHPLQRWFTRRFYRLHNAVSECEIPANVGDFRLMDRRVVDVLCAMPERRRFMKGLFAWVGFRQSVVEFDVEPRFAGQSTFDARRLWALALDGIASFSTVPLTIWAYLGIVVAIFALFAAAWIVIKTLWFGIDIPGYASLLTAILFLGGIQLIGIGVLGEYIGRIYSETKRRPVYIVRHEYGHARNARH